MVEAYRPRFRVGQGPLDGTDVVGFAVVVPGEDLNDIVLITIPDYCLPALREQMLVAKKDKLGEVMSNDVLRGSKNMTTHIFVKRVWSVVREEVCSDCAHICWLWSSGAVSSSKLRT